MAEVVDVASIPQLNGIFAPTHDELDAPLEVVEGALPTDLSGAYLRNGPNPRFTPLGSYLYPLDGDGMVHGVWFDGGTARYRNRYVRTPAIAAEEAAGRALWPGVMTGETPTEEEVGPELAGTERDLVDIHVVRHGGRLLALAEGERPFELDDQLGTVGPYTFGGDLMGMCAHPKIDPATGEMIVFRYGIESEPWLTWAVVGADGAVTRAPTELPLAGPTMIHDCAITPTHLLLVVCPLRFDFEAMFRGEPLLSWRPDDGTEWLAVPRDGGPVVRATTEAFWVWHVANAFDHDGHIVVDLPWWSHPGMGLVQTPASGGTARFAIDLASATVTRTEVDDQLGEFPRLDDRGTGDRHGWFHEAGKDPDHPPTVAGEWNRLLRYDVDGGRFQERRAGARRYGEAVFVPRSPDAAPDDGYVLTYEYDPGATTTDLVLLDGTDIAAPPVCRLRVPHRVPFGLHGSWLPA